MKNAERISPCKEAQELFCRNNGKGCEACGIKSVYKLSM